jgi:drug/metabolite transporter (DMT)-like permease
MMSSKIFSILFGLLSATSWGAGDFSGGFASKKTSVYLVILVSQFVGFLFLLAFAWIIISPIPSVDTLLIGGLAGFSAAFGLLALYHGLASGQMGVVAPVAAVIASILPVTVSIYREGKPHNLQLLGFLCAFIGVWFLSRGNSHSQIQVGSLKISVAAGVGFGLFFILIDRVSSESILWPLIAARIASVILFLSIVKARRRKVVLPKNQLFIIALAGIFDAGGTTFFALATRVGRLDIATVLSSLYPAVTVLLAWFILKERLGRQQWLGVCSVMIALILVSL